MLFYLVTLYLLSLEKISKRTFCSSHSFHWSCIEVLHKHWPALSKSENALVEQGLLVRILRLILHLIFSSQLKQLTYLLVPLFELVCANLRLRRKPEDWIFQKYYLVFNQFEFIFWVTGFVNFVGCLLSLFLLSPYNFMVGKCQVPKIMWLNSSPTTNFRASTVLRKACGPC